jgi:hypothetical protein
MTGYSAAHWLTAMSAHGLSLVVCRQRRGSRREAARFILRANLSMNDEEAPNGQAGVRVNAVDERAHGRMLAFAQDNLGSLQSSRALMAESIASSACLEGLGRSATAYGAGLRERNE